MNLGGRFPSTSARPQAQVLAGGGVAAAALGLYLWCLAPSVATGGDTGELIAASYNLGVAHPSGYALYCILGYLFAHLVPVGEVAWRYNLFSALCSAATAGVVACIVFRLTRGFWPAAVGAGLLLAGFPFFAAQAVIAEVYAPTALALALLLLLILNWSQNQEKRWLLVLAWGLGLSLNLHLSVLFLLPGLLVFFALFLKNDSAARASTSKLILPAAVCVLAGFAVTLYLPWRASTFPEPPTESIGNREYTWGQVLDWGHPVDFRRWRAHVTVQQYKSLLWEPVTVSVAGRDFTLRRFAQTPADAMERLWELTKFAALQLLWCAPLIVVGAALLWRSKDPRLRFFNLFIATMFGLNVLIAVHYQVDNVFDIANFLFPAYIVMAIWLGVGIAAFVQASANFGERLDSRKSTYASWHWRLRTLALLAVFGAVAVQWTVFAHSNSWRGNTRPRNAALERAAAAERLQQTGGIAPALLMVTDNTLFPFWYAQHVLGQAAEVLTPWGEAMHAYQDQKKLPQLVAKLIKERPVAAAQWHEDVDNEFPYAPLTPSGNLWQLTQEALPPPSQATGKVLPLQATQVLDARFIKQKAKRVELIGFQVDFVSAPTPPLQTDEENNALHIGWAEVLVAQAGLIQKPSNNSLPATTTSHTQTLRRRLVVPGETKPGAVMRTTLPLQLPIEMPPGSYNVWARVLLSSGEVSDWRKAPDIQIIVR